MSYVAAGYTPLLPKLISLLNNNSYNWNSINDIMRLLPGPLIEMIQSANKIEEFNEALIHNNSNQNSMVESFNYDGQNKKVMFILIIGGLTFLEIAAFRFLSNNSSFPYKIIMATTKVVSGSTLIKSLK